MVDVYTEFSTETFYQSFLNLPNKFALTFDKLLVDENKKDTIKKSEIERITIIDLLLTISEKLRSIINLLLYTKYKKIFIIFSYKYKFQIVGVYTGSFEFSEFHFNRQHVCRTRLNRYY